MLMLTMLLALLLAWRSSEQRAERQRTRQAGLLQYVEEELERARQELRDRDRPRRDKTRVLWEAKLDGTHLRGVTIASSENAFQGASFRDCDLKDATLQGGVSSFQFARFDNANLVNAKLAGGGASFQIATFVGADLTGAVLTGEGTAFQKSSFENATLVRARLVGSFQGVNISGTRFEGADLSALDSDSLASCYFREPPTYDGQTKFPAGFDPEALLWRRVPE
jgi:uncharacterized protein YjbI with pentapeptide repeats